ncbi:MAG: AsmA-like C-terminal region-containing protein [Ginsengibacter sp.]
MKNKYLKYFLKGTVVLLGILVILYIIVFAYVSANKQKIIKQVTNEIGKKLDGNVSIANVELSFFRHFPTVSVALHNVVITDTMYALHHHPFFNGEDVFVNVSVIKMISKSSFINGFRVEKGSLYLYTDTSGYSNSYLINPKKDSAQHGANNEERNELKNVDFNNVRITIDNKRQKKFFDIQVKKLDLDLEDKDSTVFLFSAKADMLLHSLAFNLKRGSFLKEKTFRGKFDLRYDKRLKQIQLDSIDINLQNHPFNVTAKFDMAGDNRQFSFKVNTKQIQYGFAKSLLTHKIDSALSIADVEGPLDVVASLSGPLQGADPLIFVNFTAVKTRLTTPFLDFDDAAFTGFFTNEVVSGLPRLDNNSQIVLKKFSATWHDLPVTSDKIEVVNLEIPVVTCDLQSHFTLTTLNNISGSNALQLMAGDGMASLSYKGPIESNNNTNSFINGFISFKNGNILYTPRDVELKNVNGKILFKNSNVFVENLQCNVLNNRIIMDGRALNLLSLMNTEPNKVHLDWNIYSPSLNLNAFTFLLKSRKKILAKSNSNRKLAKMANKVDDMLEQSKVDVNLKADRLIYKKFEATNALANVTLLQDRYLINNVSMDHADGRLELRGSLIAQNANTHFAKLDVSLDNVDVSRTFAAFDNFGQDGITAKSLQGKLSAKVDASLNVDNEGKADPASIVSVVDFSLKDGALNNYEPVKKLQNILFKNRDFENIRFAELKDRFEIKNQEVKINRMEIQSSVMSMFVEGIFSNKGTTDISIQVPLSNIQKRGADFNPENIGTEKKGGSSVHLRGRPGPDGNIKFKLDLFNKYKKEKDKATAE